MRDLQEVACQGKTHTEVQIIVRYIKHGHVNYCLQKNVMIAEVRNLYTCLLVSYGGSAMNICNTFIILDWLKPTKQWL